MARRVGCEVLSFRPQSDPAVLVLVEGKSNPNDPLGGIPAGVFQDPSKPDQVRDGCVAVGIGLLGGEGGNGHDAEAQQGKQDVGASGHADSLQWRAPICDLG